MDRPLPAKNPAAPLEFMHRFLPAARPEQASTLLLLHGTGGDENDLLDLGHALAPEANLLGVRGNVLEHGAPRFFRRLAEGVFDLEDLRMQTEHLAEFVASAATVFRFDESKVFAVGFSNGANIAGSLLLRRPGLLSGAILLRPMVPFIPETLPDLRRTPVYIGAGRTDPLVSTHETERLAALLQECHADVTLKYQDSGHTLVRADVDDAQKWLKTQAQKMTETGSRRQTP